MIVQPSKNKMLDAAWKGFRKEQRAEKRAPKEEPAPEVSIKPGKVKSKNAPQPRDPGRKPKRNDHVRNA